MREIIIGRRDGECPVTERLQRDMVFEVRADAVNRDSRTVELSFSSDVPYERWWGVEILDHSAGSVRLDRLNGSAALLVNHDIDEHVGVVERAWVAGNKGRAIVRFGKSAAADEVYQDVIDGIRKLVSVGYRIHRMVIESTDGDTSTYRIQDWEPFEISIVSVPADPSVGVGRDGGSPAFDPRKIAILEEDKDMTAQRDAGGNAAQVAAPVAEVRAAEPAPQPAVPAVAAAPQLDARAIAEAERARAANIRAMGARLKCADLADAAIAAGDSVETFVANYNARASQSQAIRTAESAEIGLTAAEAQRFSFVRALHALANPSDREAQRAAAFEFDVSSAARRVSGKAHGTGLTVPVDVLQRDLNVGTATAGGHLVATNLLAGSFIDLLRNALLLPGMGATMLSDLSGNLAIPRQTGGATAYWVAESGSPTESAAAFDQVTLTPRTVGAFSDISRRLLLQSSIDVEQLVQRDLAISIALEMQRVAVHGSGSSNQPTGILATSGIGSVVGGANGAAPTYAHIVGLESAVANSNADVGTLGYLTNTKVRGKLKLTEQFATTNGMPVWGSGETPLNGYKAAVTNSVSSALTKGSSSGVCSAILFGNWADLIIGMWSGLDLMVDPYTGSTSGTVRVVALQDIDVAVRHAESFAAMVDALTT